MALALEEIVRRVVGRVFAERGAPGVGSRPGGVHVDVIPSGESLRPAAPRLPDPPRGAKLWSARDVAALPDGARVSMEPGVRLTPLAEEEARRRGIRFAAGGGVAGGARLVVAVASDHGGFELKGRVLTWLSEGGHAGLDLGPRDDNAVDYPDFALAVAEAVAEGRADLGICIDGAGIGSAIAANKVPGVRAAMCNDTTLAANAREHNFANVLTLGGGMLDEGTAAEIVRVFLSTPEGAVRHERRVEKIVRAEARYAGSGRPIRRVLPEREA